MPSHYDVDVPASSGKEVDAEETVRTHVSTFHVENNILPDTWMANVTMEVVKKQTMRGLVRIFFTSLEVQIFVTLVVIGDCFAFFWHWYLDMNNEMDDDTEDHFALIEWCVLGLCAAEALGRLIGFGFHAYCRDLWNVLDGLAILVAVIVASVFVFARLSRVLRLFRRTGWCFRMFRLVCQSRKISQGMKHKVSQNKWRYVDLAGNFDLDLSYITKEVIAMSVPTEDCIMGLYRNRLKDVVRFFRTKHPDNFRIYNACPEYPYSDTGLVKAGGKIVHFQIQDHTPPTMNQFVAFLTDACELYQQLQTAVIAVHCKGGKGRTGSLVCAWLMFFRKLSPEKALFWFARHRTDEHINNRRLCGVETPSQVRYVHQLHEYLKCSGCFNPAIPPPPLKTSTRIRLKALHFENGLIAHPAKMGRLKVLVQCGGTNVSDLVEETSCFEADVASIPLNGAVVGGDVRVSVFAEKGLKGMTALDAIKSSSNAYDAKGIKLFFLFHTDFLDLTPTHDNTNPWAVESGKFRVQVEHLDRAHKKIKKGLHAAGSSVVLLYTKEESLQDPAKAETLQDPEYFEHDVSGIVL